MVRTRNRNRNEDTTNQAPAPAQSAATTQTPAQSEAPAQSTAVAERPAQRELAPAAERNAFEAYGQQMSISSITGTLIKFNKGDWVTGDDEDLEEGLELVANMDQLLVGWIKWVDNRPAEQIMGAVAERYQAPRRNELGDLDQSQWEQDDQGRARDPWQFSNYLVLKEPGQAAQNDFLYTFATSSKGGLSAIGALCKEYGKQMRVHPDEFPIVKLGADSYRHAEYGRTHVPVLTIVGWEPRAQFAEVAGSEEGSEAGAAPAASGRGRAAA